MSADAQALAARDALGVLRHLVDAYDKGVEVAFNPRDCWNALAALDALVLVLTRQEEALERIAEGRCECGGRFRTQQGTYQVRCEDCDTPVASGTEGEDG